MPARGPLQTLLQKRIPTLLGLGVLVLGVVAGIVLVGTGTGGFLPRAAQDQVPRQVRITNITDTGFTVSFLTDDAAISALSYGTIANKMSIQVQDDRDQLANAVEPYRTHHLTVRGLAPNTQYFFLLNTGGRTKFDNNGQPFNVRTARAQTDVPSAETAYGEVVSEVGNPASGAIVYLSVSGASPLSGIVKTNGSWAIPLSGLRTLDLSALATVAPETSVRVQIQGEQRGQTIELDAQVKDLMPLNKVTFGQENAVTSAAPSPTPAPAPAQQTPASTPATTTQNGFNTLVGEQECQQAAPTVVSVDVTNNETINTTQPEFSGTAPANSYVQIEVYSGEPVYGVVQTDSSGQWEWTPPSNLESGQHTITVTYTDANGVQQRVQRTFLVQADTGLPAFTSSPSGQLATPTPTPALAVATPTPTASPTATPVSTLKPATIATTSAQPVSGGTTPTWVLTLLGMSFFMIGMGSTRWWLQRRGALGAR